MKSIVYIARLVALSALLVLFASAAYGQQNAQTEEGTPDVRGRGRVIRIYKMTPAQKLIFFGYQAPIVDPNVSNGYVPKQAKDIVINGVPVVGSVITNDLGGDLVEEIKIEDGELWFLCDGNGIPRFMRDCHWKVGKRWVNRPNRVKPPNPTKAAAPPPKPTPVTLTASKGVSASEGDYQTALTIAKGSVAHYLVKFKVTGKSDVELRDNVAALQGITNVRNIRVTASHTGDLNSMKFSQIADTEVVVSYDADVTLDGLTATNVVTVTASGVIAIAQATVKTGPPTPERIAPDPCVKVDVKTSASWKSRLAGGLWDLGITLGVSNGEIVLSRAFDKDVKLWESVESSLWPTIFVNRFLRIFNAEHDVAVVNIEGDSSPLKIRKGKADSRGKVSADWKGPNLIITEPANAGCRFVVEARKVHNWTPYVRIKEGLSATAPDKNVPPGRVSEPGKGGTSGRTGVPLTNRSSDSVSDAWGPKKP